MIRAGNQKSISPNERGVKLPPTGFRSKKNSMSRNKKAQLLEHAFRSQKVDSTSDVRLGSKLTTNDSKDGSRMILYESKEVILHTSQNSSMNNSREHSKDSRGHVMSDVVSPRSMAGRESENVYRYNSQYNKTK